MKLPVWRTTLDVFFFMWDERRTAVRFGLPPVLVLFVLGVLLQVVMGTGEREAAVAQGIVGIVQIFIFLPVTVTWYRLVVMGETDANARALFTFGKREWRLLVWQILILVLVGALAFVCLMVTLALKSAYDVSNAVALLAVNILWSVGWVVAVLMILTRLSMVLALAALDQPVSLKAAWHMTRGLTGSLFSATALIGVASAAVVALFQLIGFVLGVFTAIATESALGEILRLLQTFGESLGTLISLLGIATLFGFVYKSLTAEAAASAADATP